MIARVLVVALLLAACGDNDVIPVDASTVDAVPRQTVMDTEILQPGMEIEGSWNAGPQDQIGLQLDTTVDGMDWDIHAHANGGTQDVVYEFAQMTVSYDFHPTMKTQWYLLLRNSSVAPITVNIEMGLYNQALWIGWAQ